MTTQYRYGVPTTRRPRRIDIQRDTGGQSLTDGTDSPRWVTFMSAWTVDWRTISGREILMGDQPRADVTDVVRIRWRSDATPTPGNQMVWNGKAFDINAVLDVNGQKQFWDLSVKEKAI